MGRRYYEEHTTLVPTAGGTYIEGSVGNLKPLFPWFTVTNDVNRDIVSLVFSGLLQYDPDTKKITDKLGWMPTESFETGLLKTIKWYLANEGWVNSVRSGEYLNWIKEHYS